MVPEFDESDRRLFSEDLVRNKTQRNPDDRLRLDQESHFLLGCYQLANLKMIAPMRELFSRIKPIDPAIIRKNYGILRSGELFRRS